VVDLREAIEFFNDARPICPTIRASRGPCEAMQCALGVSLAPPLNATEAYRRTLDAARAIERSGKSSPARTLCPGNVEIEKPAFAALCCDAFKGQKIGCRGLFVFPIYGAVRTVAAVKVSVDESSERPASDRYAKR
jgi:hypothetical protein